MFYIKGDAISNTVNIYQGDQKENVLLDEMYQALLLVQDNKSKYTGEDWANKFLTDLLKQRDLYVADEPRHGRSGSDKKEDYQSGEVDIVIYDPEKRGSVITMIEALELKSMGPKNQTVPKHINKLINRYDTAGNEENFIILYSRAKDFQALWTKYKNFVDNHFDYFISEIKEKEVDKSDIKIGTNYYKRSGKELILYHLFVNMYSE